MAKRTTKLRPWTATDIYKLKGLAKKKVGVDKIAQALSEPLVRQLLRLICSGCRSITEGKMKKPRFDLPEEQQPRNIQRADIAPANGNAMVVDGHFKTQYANAEGANKAGQDLLALFPMLQIEIYDASTKARTLIK